jgi:hypothetical protein
VIAAPRIIPRDELSGSAIECAPSKDPRRTCDRVIKLHGTRYSCLRETRTTDRQHDGIHDAFVEHGDGGSVRW